MTRRGPHARHRVCVTRNVRFLKTKNISFHFLLCCREATFSKYQIVHGLPPPPFSRPDSRKKARKERKKDSLECWYWRYESASVLTHRGIRRGGSRDNIQWMRMRLVWGLRKSRDASQPVNLWSVNLSWHVKFLQAVVNLW